VTDFRGTLYAAYITKPSTILMLDGFDAFAYR
jgi:hypothetical protein